MLYFIFAILGAALALAVLHKWLRDPTPRGYRKVPGPKGIPFLGSTLELSNRPQKEFKRWAKEYGEIYKIQLGWNTWYMLNSPEAVKEIMDKQSLYTSSRVPMPVTSDALSGGMRFLLMPYGPEWRKLRSMSHKLLTPKMSNTFKPSQEFESLQLLYDILTNNNNDREFYMHVRRYTVSVIMTSTYGRRVPIWDCEDVREIYGLMKDFSEIAAPGKYLADTIPPLGKLPVALQWWRKSILPLQQRQAIIWMKYWTSLKIKMDTGQAPECFVKQCIETDYEKQGITELQAAFLAGSMIEAGSETTSSALNTCILYLSGHPQVRSRAHEELNRVVGNNRLPTFEDEPFLPYICAIVKETLRIRPVTNIGTPHYTTAPITYKDFFIPEGSIVAIQQYAIHFNPAYYSDPDEFKPERYLGHSLKAGASAASFNPYDRDHFGFGAGRRICAGLHLAENSLFITVARILWLFDILPPLGPDKRELPVDLSDDAYESGGNTLPKRFAARFIPRNSEVVDVLKSEWENIKDSSTFRITKA
ncbi:cytochrome P450 76C3 [Xylogone sp. PMI_703]|nr:cytochrome P450 76C3 [Xylogone sp. PMI_703]